MSTTRRVFVKVGIIALCAVVVGLAMLRSGQIIHHSVSNDQLSAAEQHTLNQAVLSEPGKQLANEGLQPKKPLQRWEDQGLKKFLDEWQARMKVPDPGDYVVYTRGSEIAAPDPRVAPGTILDTKNQTIVALTQSFSNHRGTTCFNMATKNSPMARAVLKEQWVPINLYLKGQSLEQEVRVEHKHVRAIPEGMSFPCYLHYIDVS